MTKMRNNLSSVLLLLGAVIGCQSQEDQDIEMKPELPHSQQVKIEGEEASSKTFTPREFKNRLQKSLAAEQRLLAREFVNQYFDEAHKVLVTVNPKSKPKLWNFLCEALNNQAWFGVRSLSKNELDNCYKILADFRFNLEQDSGNSIFHKNLQGLNVPKVLLAEMLRLRGLAYFLKEDYETAEFQFQKASQLSKADLYLCSRCLLYLGESQRRQNKLGSAAKNWRLSLEQSLSPKSFGGLGRGTPKYWASIIYWKQAKVPWPPLVDQQIMKQLGFVRLGAATVKRAQNQSQALLWALIAEQQQRRKNYQEALSAAKKAEVLFQDQSARWRMQLAAAQALLAMKKLQTATSMLVDLGQNSQGASQSGALAILGSLALNNDKFRRGHGLLVKAVHGDDWPGKGEAMADLGLACFLIGETTEGTRWLKNARQRFAKDQRFQDYLQSLGNEKAYFKHLEAETELKRLNLELQKFRKVRKL